MSLAVPVACPPRDFARTRRRRRSFAAAFALVLASFAAPAAWAQQAIVGPEDIVATGFSGLADGAAPAGTDPLDYKIIAPSGPSARVVDVSRLGPQGGLSRVSKPFTVTAAEIGQVFGVALDDAQAPNIYLAATAAYGLSIGVADPSGAMKRLRQGDVGADYIPGMFGPSAEGGGPGSIWRIDGASGQATNFANIGDGLPASLGALAFDPKSQQLFVSDRATGLIHRLGLDGTDRGNFDHGVEARPAAGLPDAPLAPISVDITTADFDTEQPATWGFADPERLVFGLAVRDDRLYYAVAAGPEIWSVGIVPDGSFAADARFEVEVPALQAGMEVAQIAFDGEGRLYAAERSPPTGAYDFQALAAGGDSRVLRFLPKPAPDGNPGFWLPDPETYAIGLAPEHRNADGGVVLGRGYDRNGRLAPEQCRATLWSTGEKLLGESASIDPLDGLQGNDPSLVIPTNVPPMASWFVDYDDLPGDPLNSGHMGALAVPACQGGVRAEIPPPPPPVIVNCPVGTMLVGGNCLLPPRCPPGTRFRDGYCVVVGCPPDMVRVNGACVPPPRICDRYETFVNGRCLPWACPGDLLRMPNGYCGCPPSEIYLRGKCVPPPACPPGMVQTRDGRCLPPPCPEFWQRDRAGRCLPPECRRPFVQDRAGRCVCPPNLLQKGRECLPPPKQCPPGFVAGPKGRCVCPPNLILKRGVCVPPPVVQPCPEDKVRDAKGRCVCPPNLILKRGVCVPPPVVQPCPEDKVRDAKGRCVCPPNLILKRGVCVPPPVVQPCPEGKVRDAKGRCVCPPNLILKRGVCVPPPVVQPCPEDKVRDAKGRCVCPPNTIQRKGRCVPPPVVQPCPEGQLRDKRGRCVCPQGLILRNGVCRPPIVIDCSPGFVLKGGQCIPVLRPDLPIRPIPPKCDPGERFVNGRCITVINPGPLCKKGTVLRDGRCVPIRIETPQNDNPEPPVLRQPGIQLIVPGKTMMVPQDPAPQ